MALMSTPKYLDGLVKEFNVFFLNSNLPVALSNAQKLHIKKLKSHIRRKRKQLQAPIGLQRENCFGYSKSESCCKQNMVFTPILRSLSTSSGAWKLAGEKSKNHMAI
jgi:hypothetical protein